MNDSDAEDEDRDINSLPDELLLTLFKYFSPSFICKSISLVCKRWAEVASDATLWEACHCHVGRRWRCKGFPVRQEFICAKLCHLKELSFTDCGLSLTPRQLLSDLVMFSEACPRVESLDLTGAPEIPSILTEEFAAVLLQFRSLQKLKLNSSNHRSLTGAFFEADPMLQKVEFRLQELHIPCSSFHDVLNLSCLKRLHTLDLHLFGISTVTPINVIPSLRHLRIHNHTAHLDWESLFRQEDSNQLRNLESLQMNRFEAYPSFLLAVFRCCQKLKTIEVGIEFPFDGLLNNDVIMNPFSEAPPFLTCLSLTLPSRFRKPAFISFSSHVTSGLRRHEALQSLRLFATAQFPDHDFIHLVLSQDYLSKPGIRWGLPSLRFPLGSPWEWREIRRRVLDLRHCLTSLFIRFTHQLPVSLDGEYDEEVLDPGSHNVVDLTISSFQSCASRTLSHGILPFFPKLKRLFLDAPFSCDIFSPGPGKWSTQMEQDSLSRDELDEETGFRYGAIAKVILYLSPVFVVVVVVATVCGIKAWRRVSKLQELHLNLEDLTDTQRVLSSEDPDLDEPRTKDEEGNELRDGQKLLEEYWYKKRRGLLEAERQVLLQMNLSRVDTDLEDRRLFQD